MELWTNSRGAPLTHGLYTQWRPGVFPLGTGANVLSLWLRLSLKHGSHERPLPHDQSLFCDPCGFLGAVTLKQVTACTQGSQSSSLPASASSYVSLMRKLFRRQISGKYKLRDKLQTPDRYCQGPQDKKSQKKKKSLKMKTRGD